MTRFRSIFIGLLLLSGCAAVRNADRAAEADQVKLPDPMKQPRLWQLLEHLSQNGFESAADASVFEFTAWPMYAHPDWADEPHKPRYEGATVRRGKQSIVFAVSPVEPLTVGAPDVVYTVETRSAKQEAVTGAAVLLPRRTWVVAFTLKEPDARLQAELTELLCGFVRQFSIHPPHHKS